MPANTDPATTDSVIMTGTEKGLLRRQTAAADVTTGPDGLVITNW